MKEVLTFLKEWWGAIFLVAILLSPLVMFIGFNGIVRFQNKVDEKRAERQRKRLEKRALAKKDVEAKKAVEDEYTPSKEIQFTNYFFETNYKGSDKIHNGKPSGIYVNSVEKQFDWGEYIIVFVGSRNEYIIITNQRIFIRITSPTRRTTIAGQIRQSAIKAIQIGNESYLLVVNNQAIGYLPITNQYDREFITGFLAGLLQLVKEDTPSRTISELSPD